MIRPTLSCKKFLLAGVLAYSLLSIIAVIFYYWEKGILLSLSSAIKRVTIIISLTLLSLIGLAQTGPGGVGTIDGTSSLKMWLRADKNVSYDNLKNIVSWTDFSGNNFVLTSSGTAPVFASNTINGMPVVNFNSNVAGLVKTAVIGNTLFSSLSNTIIFVKQSVSGAYWFNWQSTIPTNQVSFLLSANKAVYNSPNDTNGQLTSTTSINGAYHILSNRTDGTNQTIFIDGALDATRANGLTLNTAASANLYLGTYDGSATNGWTGFIAEGMVFNISLNSAQRTLVENYMSAKYNLTIANDHYAGDNSGNGNYDYEVAGIGAETDGKNSVANSSGLYLTENGGSLAAGEYVMAGHANQVENLTSSDVTGSVTHRWNRNWYIDKTGTVDTKISFDFSEGINGGTPGMVVNYVLLYRAGTSGSFSNVAGTSASIENTDQVYFNVPNANLASGFYTLGTTSAIDSPLDGIKTWYNYSVDNNDNWDNWERWTLDPDGTQLINPYHLTPGASDNVVILNGGNVNITGLVTKAAASVEIRTGGILIISGISPKPNFNIIKGDGLVRLSGDNYPGDGTRDADFKTKGSVEYNGAGYTLSTSLTYYNLIINLTTPASIITLKSNLTVGRDFTIQQGAFRINDAANDVKYIINVTRNVSIPNSNGQITTGTGDPTNGAYSYGGTMPGSGHFHDIYHELNIGGDFINFGTVKFTNLTAPTYNNFATNGAVSVKFNGASNNNISLYGPATFYNLIIDKGTSQSYIETIYSSDVTYFNLYGGNAVGINETAPFDAANPEVRKALFIKNGTLKLTGNIYIHSLSEGNMVSGNGDYAIGANSCLWIAGAGVTVYSTANDGTQAPAGTIGINTGMGNQAVSISGKFRISDGTFGTHNSGGLIFLSDYSGIVQIEGGTVDVSQFRSTNGSSGKPIYIHSGGTLTVRGDLTEPGEIDNNYPLFGLVTNSDNFIMSGGIINVFDISTGSGFGNNAFYINSATGNYSVTGGTVNIKVNGNTTFPIYSTSNLWNLNLQRYNAANIVTLRLNTDIVVSGSLLVDENTIVDMTASGAARDLTIGGNLTLGSTGASTSFFTTGTGGATPTTISIIGSGNSVINIYNTVTAGLFDPYNMVINKENASNTVSITSAGREAGTPPLNIKGDFIIANGRFDYSVFTIDVKGNLINTGVMGVWNKTGRIRLNNTASQQTITGGIGSGILFGHIEVAHTDGSANNVKLNSNASCDLFTLTSGRMFIQNYRLSVDTNFVTFVVAGTPADRMIETMADNANRGVKFKMDYNYNSTKTVTFPVGTYDGINHYWAKCDVSIAATVGNVAGYLTIIPVPLEHPAKVGGGCTNLAYYWKAISSGLGGTTGGVQYAFLSPLPDPGGGTKEYFLLNGGVWTADANYSSTLTFEPAIINGFATGDFTAGKNACFNNVNYVYSNGTGGGIWRTGASWTGGAAPQTYDIAVIRTGDVITVDRNTSDDAGTVVINAGGTLDVGIYTGLDYRIIQGGGKFRIASNTANTTPTLPTGDFDPFLVNDTSIFEYYGTASYPLPTAISYYSTLKIGGSAGTVKTLPAIALTVNKDLLIYDNTNTGVVLSMNSSSTSGYDLTVKGSIKFDRAGVFRFPATGAVRTVTVEKSIELNTNGNLAANSIEIENAAGIYSNFHKLIVKESIIMNQNALVTLFRNTTNRRAVDLSFLGSGNSQITAPTPNSSTPALALNTLTINKNLSTNQVLVSSNISFTSAIVRPITITNGHLILDNSNINISLSAGAGNFTIPSGGRLSLRNGAIANITGVTTGLILDGALSVENNSQMLVNDGTNDNFIEYGSSGFSSISVSATATLTVGSQIRRKTTSEAGTLLYSQTGGTVTIGNSSAPTSNRAVFEVLKPGGNFTYTGGNLIIVRAQSATNPALFLDPETFSLSGGATITFGSANTPAGSKIGIYSSIPLKNIVVSSSGGSKTVKLYTLGLIIDSLNINPGQTFDANGINLTLNGNFHNSGTFTAAVNTTSFTGSKQKLIGATTFNNLAINTADSVVLRNNITINGNLDITLGKFSDCANTITLEGNFVNNGTHYSASNLTGGVLFNGTTRQKVSGAGIFGRLNINNPNGVELLNDFKLVDRNIFLTNGSLYIRQFKLQLGERANVITTGSFSKDKMIVTNGAISDLGVERAIPSGTPSDILIPIGVNGKYSPVGISQLSTVGSGYIRVRPVNQYHPTVIDPNNVLQYYWNLQTSGFSSFKARLSFNYNQSDVFVTSPAIESDYIPAYLSGVDWAKFDSKDIDANSNIIVLNFNSGDNLNGDFTAGISAAIPDLVPVFYTTNDGNWEDVAVWAREDGSAVTGYPSGYVVKIRHNITVTLDQKNAYKTIIESGGTLSMGTTIVHYLGQISGVGKLAVATGRLPAGNYENFFSCSGGTMEFGGTGSYEISDQGTIYRNLIFSGSGTRTLSYKDLTICESFLINGPSVDNGTYNNKITLNGSFTLQSGSFNSGAGSNATLVFGGTQDQIMSGNFTGDSKLNNLTMNNPAGLTFSGNITMAGLLTLTNGIIITGANTFTMEVAATVNPVSGTSTSYINGPLSKVLSSGSNFTFPIGKAYRNGMFTATNTSTVSELIWKVEYFNTDTPNRLPGNLEPGIVEVSDEYWTVTPPTGTSPVTLRWDAFSNINGLTAGGMSNIRLVQYVGTLWTVQAATISGTSTNTYGTITTNSAISFASGTPVNFALASVTSVVPSANFISADTSICAGQSVNLQINLTNGTSWTLVYNDGAPHTVSPINSSPYTLTLTPASTTTYTLTSITNQVPISGIATGSVTVTVSPLPVATFSYAGSPYCPNDPNPSPTFSGGGVAGTFSSTPGLLFVSSSTGQVNLASSTPGTYTVTNTISTSGHCGIITATSPITISRLIWTGVSGTDWNVPGNWSCGFVPYSTSHVQIPDAANEPVINSGVTAEARNITIENGSSLTVASGTLMIYGSVTSNNGIATSDGTVAFAGSSAQSIGNNIFSGNTVKNLTITNNSGVTLQGPLSVSGVVLVQNGTLASDGNLTLISDAAGTALIDGSGTGNITGNVTMQRYLSSGFGYKYFSSPFQGSTVGEFGDDMDLTYAFPLFYRFNENSGYSGWINWTNSGNPLTPLEGYAVNFGELTAPKTVDVIGLVSNGSLSVTLFNHDSLYTEGFNLVGNPYPSPVDWAAGGWTKSNIDDALYYFKESETDQYGGTYSTYVNGESSDGAATNIIPSMQGFFVHVSDGTFPVTGTLGVNNSVRVNDLTHPFLKSAKASDHFLLRATAAFTDDNASADPLVVYFDAAAENTFDGEYDALKLMNTDLMVTNFYSVLPGDVRLSINALPNLADSILYVPLGLKIHRDGEVRFKLADLKMMPPGMNIYFRDALTGINTDLLPSGEYKVTLSAGDYDNRFLLAFQKTTTGIITPGVSTDIFTAYYSDGLVKSAVWTIDGDDGLITVYDLSGRLVYAKKVYEAGHYDLIVGVKRGMYIIRYSTGKLQRTVKLIIGI